MACPPSWALDPVILCFGDSLTAGFGVGADESYPALLQKRLQEKGYPHKVVNAGVSGDTTAGAARRLSWSLRTRPTVAIVVLGANDGLRGLSVAEMEHNLDEMITTLHQNQVRVILGGMRLPPNYGAEYTARFAAAYPRLAEKHQLPLIPFFLEGVAGQVALNSADGIHPNAKGYQLVLENVWQVLAGVLETGRSMATSN